MADLLAIPSKLSKTCQVWYQIKGFDKCNLTKPDLNVFVVICVKGQGQSRLGPKIRSKFKIVQNMSSLVSNERV